MKRSAFLAASASLVASGGAVEAATTVPGGTHLVERKADFDAAAFAQVAERPADVRQLWEAVSFHPTLLSNIKNSLNGLQFGFGYAPDRVATVVCGHGPSSVYTYEDVLWSKYRLSSALGLKDAQGNPVTSNLYLTPKSSLDPSVDPDDPGGFYQDTSVPALRKRGAVFLACHTAIEEQARTLVKGGFAPAGMSAQDVANDILTHLVAGTVVVPSMVAAIAVLQIKHDHAYTTLTL
ncbi:MAG: hypothetical protein ACXVAM_00250 [Vulcanimicrobiaceae bacterium]